MNKQKEFKGITYYPDSDKESSYYYIPASPVPQTDSNGHPVISITGGGSQWFLQAGTKWSAPSEVIEDLARKLIDQELIQSPNDLNPAPVQVGKVELILNTLEGSQVLASSDSSGHYPFTAAFSTRFSTDVQKEVVAAFHGKKEVLMVKYYATLEIKHPVEMTLSGPLHQADDNLNRESTTTEIEAWLVTQIQQGTIAVTRQFDEKIPEHVIEQSKKKLMDEAVDEIRRYLTNNEKRPDTSAFEVRVNETITIPEELITETDISTWFNNSPNEHIKIIT